MSAVRNYILVTLAYWAFTITDGALRMLVLLHFHQLGYAPVQLAFLFVFYELFGVVTNLLGGYVAARFGLRFTLLSGLALQVFALTSLAFVAPGWSRALSVAYVMFAQSLSGIAKDLTKMSAKSSIKLLVPDDKSSVLFRWVAVLTGSKNALKGVGFFLGGLLLATLGFRASLFAMAGALALVLFGSMWSLPKQMGRTKAKAKFKGLLSKTREVNVLSLARFFLFGARDVWFVVGVPVFLTESLGYGFAQVGALLSVWVIGYGVVQALAPVPISWFTKGKLPEGGAARLLALALGVLTGLIAYALSEGVDPAWVALLGLGAFGVVFAVNSSVHSYLILAYSDGDEVAMNVGFYYMANAGGRLLGTLLSGVMFQYFGVVGCLWSSAVLAGCAWVCSFFLPEKHMGSLSAVRLEGGD